MNFFTLPNRTIWLLAVLFVFPFDMTKAQMQVNDVTAAPFTPQNLISNVFLGQGVDVTNINFQGVPEAVGYFSGGAQRIGIDRGIILTSGYVESSGGLFGGNGAAEVGGEQAGNYNFSFASNPSLANIATSDLYDAAVYTITFIPTSDTLRFRYCFASEEYPEYACQGFNDVFGFFIQGPGYATPTNIALIPGTNLPVSIDNIHPTNPGVCGPMNQQYFNNNINSNLQPVYDGFTDVFTAMAVVTPCVPYTITLAISDVGDSDYDSAVFLEAKSFGAGSLKVEAATVSADGSVTEGCSVGSVTFSLPEPAAQNFPISYIISGTATNGVDYTTIPANLFIPAGQQQITIPVEALEDNTAETPEFVALDVQTDPCHRDTVIVFIRDNAMPAPQLIGDTLVCSGSQSLQLDGTVPGAIPPPPMFTNTQDFSIAPVGTSIISTINVFGVHPAILGPGVIKSVCINIDHNWIDDMDIYLQSPSGQILELTTDNGSDANDFTNTCFTPSATTPIKSVSPSLAPFTGDWKPEGVWDDLWDGDYLTNGQWKLLVKDDGNGNVGTLLDWSITFEPSYEINYAWTPAANVSCADCPVTQVMSSQSQVYVVEATDSYGCKTRDSVRVGLDLLDIVASVTDSISCFGEADGSLAVSLGGSSSAVNYLWSTGQTTTTVDNLTAGTYTVSISNVSGCSTTLNVVLPEPEALLSDVMANDLTCFGTPTGSITSQITGGTLPYTYLWNNGATTADLTNIAAGTYSVTVSDKYGCSSVSSAAITQPQELVASVTPSAAACNGGSTGSAIVSVAGGVGPYDFKWNDPAGQTTQVAVNLPTGTYQVTVFDANGCTLVRTANISQPPALQLNAIPQSVSCNGGNNGAISMQINGGVSPYQYQWNTGATTANLIGQPAGSYTVTVTDANLCTQTRTETIIEPAVIVLWPDENPVKCYDGNTGSITVSTTGGTGNFSFVWSGPNGYTGTGDEIGQLYAGTYTTTVTDANACTSSVEVTVSQPAAPLQVPLPEVSDTICFGNSDGVAVATPTGGTAPYQYLWSNGQTDATATALATTFYNITVTDANQCTTVGFTFIDQRQVMFSFAESTPPKCHDGADGTATVSAVFYGAVSQDLGQFSYTWNTTPSQTVLVATGLNASQSYEVTVTDISLGCSSTQTVTVGNRFALSAETFGIEPVKCYGDSTGRAAIQASGGTPPYSWFWSPGPDVQTDSIATGLPAGNFKVTVTDDAGCTAVKTVLIEQPEKLQNTLSQTEVNCYGESSGKAKANVSGGVSPYQYIWWNGRQTPEIDQLAAGTIGVTVTDANGCYRSDSIVVRQPEAPLSGLAEAKPIRCSGDRDGRIAMQVEGGTPPYRYGLNNSNLNGSTVQIGLKAGAYVPRIVDQRGCELTLDTVLLEEPEPFTVDLGPDITIDLGQDTMLEAQVSDNALEPLSFRWSSDDLKWLSCGDCFNPLVGGLDFTRLFNVVVTDSLGCVAEDAIRLIVDKPRRVHVPTGFSPNGDINNDRLLVHGQSSATALSFQVFDRWGELMFEANNFQLNDVNTGWDGTFRGKDCDPGVYIWLLEVQYQDGVKEILKGNTTLIR